MVNPKESSRPVDGFTLQNISLHAISKAYLGPRHNPRFKPRSGRGRQGTATDSVRTRYTKPRPTRSRGPHRHERRAGSSWSQIRRATVLPALVRGRSSRPDSSVIGVGRMAFCVSAARFVAEHTSAHGVESSLRRKTLDPFGASIREWFAGLEPCRRDTSPGRCACSMYPR